MTAHVSRRAGLSRQRMLIVGACLAVLIAGAVWVFAPRSVGQDSQADRCRTQTYDVAVTPRMNAVVKEGLAHIADDCVQFRVNSRTADQVALTTAFGGAKLPSLWVPETSWTVDALRTSKIPLHLVSDSLASTPLLVAAAPGAEPSRSWSGVLSNPAVALPDPTQDVVGSLALAASHVEGERADRSAEETKELIVTTAQRYGALAATGKTSDLSLDTLKRGDARRVVTTEQDFVMSGADVATDATPRSGTIMMEFPLVVPDGASPNLRAVAADLARWFTSEDGHASLRSHGLRNGDGEPLPGGAGAGRVKAMTLPDRSVVEADLGLWRILGVPSSILAVIDVSGSMDFPAPSAGRRIDVAVDVARTALAAFPDHARIGLWAFSIHQDGRKDYRVLEPLRRLDAKVDGRTQRQVLDADADLLPELTQGGTGLNDTVLAAYTRALEDYDPNYSNALIILTDGENDDPGSISEEKLLAELARLRDDARPVRIVAIGLTQDADLPALERIAGATGGNAYRADSGADILGVISSEIANR